MSRKKPDPKIETRLAPTDMELFHRMAVTAKTSKADLAREGIRWYMNNYETVSDQHSENATAQAIRYATDHIVKAINGAVDRICKMLYRQGRAIATLYELSWMSLPDDEGRRAFEEAAKTAKQRMAQHVEMDERELAERMKTVVTAPSFKSEKTA